MLLMDIFRYPESSSRPTFSSIVNSLSFSDQEILEDVSLSLNESLPPSRNSYQDLVKIYSSQEY